MFVTKASVSRSDHLHVVRKGLKMNFGLCNNPYTLPGNLHGQATC